VSKGWRAHRQAGERKRIEKLTELRTRVATPCAICGGRVVRGIANNEPYCERCGNAPPSEWSEENTSTPTRDT
jgi:endogenous inhibitor of DNA gyrase (YacG/DUF329 family)